ncbi:MmgE/PrpD family protein [Chloroflexota bacterium]
MKSLTEELADFVTKSRFERLPQPVVYETKRILLDSIGCALVGLATDKGKLSIELARRLGGPPESTIMGIGDKVSCASAGFANGELINALDYDSLPHISPYVIPAPLALAESIRAPGKALILAIVLGYEISARMLKALTPPREYVNDGPEKGKIIWPWARGYASTIFGGTAAAGKTLGLQPERMVHALGIAGYMCPVPAMAKWWESPPAAMAKYPSAGWLAQAEITSALLAQMGYTGDISVLDGEYGFWRFFSATKWEPKILIENLGEEWHLLETAYKPYPCCRVMHSGLDCFKKIIDDNNLRAEDIETINVLLDPMCDKAICRNNQLKTHVDAQFSVAYVFSAMAHGIRIGADWQSLDSIRNPRILDFMKRVKFDPHSEYGKAALEDPYSRVSMVEVVANGKTFKEETRYAKGTPFPEEARMTDQELSNKFRENASRILPWEKIDKALQLILDLEEMDEVSGLMEALTL